MDNQATSRPHVLLLHYVAIILFAMFGPGLQSIPVCTLLLLLVNLSLCFQVIQWKLFVALSFTANWIGSWLAYMFLMGTDPVSMVFTLGFCALLGAASVGIIWAPSKLLLQHPMQEMQYYHIYIFPVLVTAFWSFTTAALPNGSWGNWAYSLIKFNSVGHITALFGLDGINFVVAWTASIIFHYQYIRKTLLSTSHDILSSKENDESIATESTILKKAVFSRAGLVWFCSVSFLLFISGARQVDWRDSFFQKDISLWKNDYIVGRCKIAYNEEFNATVYSRIAETETELQSPFGEDIDIYLWSETCVDVFDAVQRDFLYSETQRLARENNVTIGMTYLQSYIDPRDKNMELPQRNMFFIVNSYGDIVVDYQKVNPVIGVEVRVAPGEGPSDIYASEYGINIGGAICYDFDFPLFINSAVKEGGLYADLMLQPGWDWGAIGITHARMETVRAIENGVSLFRCSSGGISGVYDHFGGIIYEKVTKEAVGDGYKVEIPLLNRVGTLYIHIGGTFGFICIILAAFVFIIPGYKYCKDKYN